MNLSKRCGLFSLAGALTVAGSLAFAADVPLYKPPSNEDLSPARIVGATVRGTSDESLSIAVLAPDHTGLTVQAQPNLYWHISRPLKGKVTVTIQDDKSAEPLVESTVDVSLKAGLVRVPVRKTQASLSPGVEYQWSVSVKDNRADSLLLTTSGVIKRVQSPAGLEKDLSEAKPERQAFVQATHSIWYDALGSLDKLVDKDVSAPGASEQRAALLRQVGLDEIAGSSAGRAQALAIGVSR